MLTLKKNTIEIGLEKPLKILHITDSHLPFYCETDSEAMINQGKKRDEELSVQSLEEEMKYGEENGNYLKRLRSKNLIPVKPNTTYAFAHPFSRFGYNIYQFR